MKSQPNQREKKVKFDCSTTIYRYIPFQRLAQVLINKEISLARPRTWDDPFESWRINSISKNNSRNHTNIKNYFGQCWTLHYLDDAMWSLYSKGTDGFRIRATVGRLIESFDHSGVPYNIAKVKYLERNKIEDYLIGNKFLSELDDHFDKFSLCNGDTSQECFLETAKKLMIKRKGFAHEKEIRLVCYKDMSDQADDYFMHPICPHRVIDQIVIHPRVNLYDYEVLKCALRRIGFRNEIARSELHDMTPVPDDNPREVRERR